MPLSTPWRTARSTRALQRVAQGKSKWFCTACMKGFVHNSEEEPQVCPKGHRIDDPELTGNIGLLEKEAVAE